MDKLLEKPDLQEAAKNPFLGVYKFRSREKIQTSDVFILYYSCRRWYHINYVEGHRHPAFTGAVGRTEAAPPGPEPQHGLWLFSQGSCPWRGRALSPRPLGS